MRIIFLTCRRYRCSTRDFLFRTRFLFVKREKNLLFVVERRTTSIEFVVQDKRTFLVDFQIFIIDLNDKNTSNQRTNFNEKIFTWIWGNIFDRVELNRKFSFETEDFLVDEDFNRTFSLFRLNRWRWDGIVDWTIENLLQQLNWKSSRTNDRIRSYFLRLNLKKGKSSRRKLFSTSTPIKFLRFSFFSFLFFSFDQNKKHFSFQVKSFCIEIFSFFFFFFSSLVSRWES